jgi:hypothetical protein
MAAVIQCVWEGPELLQDRCRTQRAGRISGNKRDVWGIIQPIYFFGRAVSAIRANKRTLGMTCTWGMVEWVWAVSGMSKGQ